MKKGFRKERFVVAADECQVQQARNTRRRTLPLSLSLSIRLGSSPFAPDHLHVFSCQLLLLLLLLLGAQHMFNLLPIKISKYSPSIPSLSPLPNFHFIHFDFIGNFNRILLLIALLLQDFHCLLISYFFGRPIYLNDYFLVDLQS